MVREIGIWTEEEWSYEKKKGGKGERSRKTAEWEDRQLFREVGCKVKLGPWLGQVHQGGHSCDSAPGNPLACSFYTGK